MIVDRFGKDCESCGRGRFIETGFFDDVDGVLHCNVCGKEIIRHITLTDGEKFEIVLDLLRKIVGPYTHDDDINCLDDVLILIRKTLDEIGETW